MPLNEHLKQCVSCKQEKRISSDKTVSEFWVHSRSKDGFRNECKVCGIEKSKVYEQARPPLNKRNKHLRRRYGIEHPEYLRLLELQDGKCAICETADPGKGFKYFQIDHAHLTGEIRGLLCATCNKAIGLLKDDVVRLDRAIKYLRKTPPSIMPILKSPSGGRICFSHQLQRPLVKAIHGDGREQMFETIGAAASAIGLTRNAVSEILNGRSRQTRSGWTYQRVPRGE